MNINGINEDFLCILKHDKKTDKIVLDAINIEKDLEKEFNDLLTKFETFSTANSIVQFIVYHWKLKVLFESYNYCTHLNGAYQGLYSTTAVTIAKYPSKFNHIKDNEKKQNAIDDEKNKLLQECKERLHANYLMKAYKKCVKDKEILAFSHRKVGWSNPKYDLNEDFSIELKTNFGYGSASFFYTKIRYKNLDIVPFSDWVNYQISKIYEIVQYSSKHMLNNSSWYQAMTYVAEACNISATDEELFIKKYIIEQCEELVRGLEKILTNNNFRFKGYAFLNQERGYIDLKLDDHNLTEFRGEKISGALDLIPPIKGFVYVTEVKNYVESIERYNIQMKPMILEEQRNIESKLEIHYSKKVTLEPKYIALVQENTIYQNKRTALRNSLLIDKGSFGQKDFEEKFNIQNPNYKETKEQFELVTKDYHELLTIIRRYENVLENLKEYESKINEYFESKDKTG